MRISIEGLIGAGKSLVIDAFSHHAPHDVAVFPEPVTSWGKYLDLFYADPAQWGLPLSIKVLMSFRAPGATSTCIVERSPVTCVQVFARLLFNSGHMSQPQWDLLKEMAEVLSPWVPDAVVYIDTPVETCLERIHSRGRVCESTVDEEYLRKLQSQYDVMLRFLNKPVIRIDGTQPAEAVVAQATAAINRLLLSDKN